LRSLGLRSLGLRSLGLRSRSTYNRVRTQPVRAGFTLEQAAPDWLRRAFVGRTAA